MRNLINLIKITFTLAKMAWKKTLPATKGRWTLSTRTFRGERQPMKDWAWVSPVYPDAVNVVNATGVYDAVKMQYVRVDGQPVTTAGWNGNPS